MTTLDSLGGADPEPAEVSDASLAMADYDAKGGNYAAALTGCRSPHSYAC